jgi:hypothetical protein
MLGILNKNSTSIRAGTSRLLNVSLNNSTTQTQKTTPGPKESKAELNILPLKSDPMVFTLETRPEADQVGHALSPTGTSMMTEATIASVLPGPYGWLVPGIRKCRKNDLFYQSICYPLRLLKNSSGGHLR